MSAELHLRIAGAMILALAALNLGFPKRLGWREELQRVSLLTRQVFAVHAAFIILLLVLIGVLSLVFADALVDGTRLGRVILTGLAVFWGARLVTQLFVYDRAIWQGDRFRTAMHVAFTWVWSYFVFVYVYALQH
jgi:steroid 5-alpha reductase family enzyme